MTPRELESAYEGYRQRRLEDWEILRWSAFYNASIHSKKVKITDIKLPVDQKTLSFDPSKHKLAKVTLLK